MRTRSVFLILLLGVIPSLLRAQDAPPERWRERLRQAVARATSESPDLRAMEARISAARHRVEQADALPDPELELALKDVPPSDLSLTRDDFTMQMVAARQRFPGPGKRAGARKVTEAALASVTFEHARHLLAVEADVVDSYFRLAVLDRQIEIAERTRRRFEDAAESARERYRVGKGPQADALRASLEKTSVDERLSSLKAERRGETARFNILQFLPGQTPQPMVQPGEIAAADVAALAPVAELLKRAEEESPSITAAQAEIRRAEAEVDLARLERRIDWTVMTYYSHRRKFEDLIGASVSFSLPFTHPVRLARKEAEKRAELGGARADLDMAKNALRLGVEMAHAELQKNLEQARLYRDSILPQAEINYRAAREAYAVGQVDFLTLIRAATDWDMYETAFVERSAGIARALAALQKASGLPLIETVVHFEGKRHEK